MSSTATTARCRRPPRPISTPSSDADRGPRTPNCRRVRGTAAPVRVMRRLRGPWRSGGCCPTLGRAPRPWGVIVRILPVPRPLDCGLHRPTPSPTERCRDRTVTDHDLVLVVDFGAQYAQLIARRVREARVYSEIVPHTMPVAEMLARGPKAIILSGGPSSVYEPGAPNVDAAVFEAGVPVFGMCYGFQAMALNLGGEVRRTGRSEYGRTPVEVVDGGTLLADVPRQHRVWMSHGDSVVAAPAGFDVLASTADTPVAAFEDLDRRLAGVQWHPEVMHTEHGQQVLSHFLLEIAGCRPTWTMVNIVEEQIEAIRTQIGDRRAICGLSGVSDPEEKRKIIGREFIRVFEAAEIEIMGDAAARGERVDFLVQGTLYPDVVESGGGAGTSNIKSHHNVGGLPEDLEFELVEPLRTLFKDEVRLVGEQLGLPADLVWRHPFPGPGLAIRIVGDVTHDRLEILREADAIAREEVTRAGLDREIWQFPVVLLADVRSVGVQGDGRTYGHPVVLRPVTSEDAMTADWTRLPYDLLAKISNRITNEVDGVNRVVLDVTSKPPGTIEWE